MFSMDVASCLTGFPPPALSLVDVDASPPSARASEPQDAKSLLDSIFDGLMYAVPKRRRSLQVRLMRKAAHTRIAKFATPKKNLTSCLECGHWHEVHTLCGESGDSYGSQSIGHYAYLNSVFLSVNHKCYMCLDCSACILYVYFFFLSSYRVASLLYVGE